MRRRMVVWTVAAVLAALAGAARAAHQEELGRAGLEAEAAQNRALARYIKNNGMPDVAAIRPIVDDPPWDDHEVTLYYLDRAKEVSFARARILGSPQVHLMRSQRMLTDADIHALRAHAGLATEQVAMATTETTCTGSATERAECAATRAENAADRVDVAAGRAEKAADRTEAVVGKMTASAPTHKKHHHAH